MVGGAWRATVHRVAKNQAQLKHAHSPLLTPPVNKMDQQDL